jgi:hypothetical protein
MKQVAMAAVSCVWVVVVGAAGVSAAQDWSPAALAEEAERVREVVTQQAVVEWLGKAKELPEVEGQTLFVGPRVEGGFDREVYTPRQARDLSEEDLAEFRAVTYGPERYYATNYGSPIAYATALACAADAGIESFAFKRILDIGYGQIGQLEMLARCGAEVDGVEVDPVVHLLYASTRLTDTVVAEDGTRGRVSLHCGQWFRDWNFRKSVGKGYDLILARNVLKRGYVHPEEPMQGFDPIDVGGDAAMGAQIIYEALEPGGIAVVYNLGGGPWRREDGSYNAPADVRDPFGREAWEAAGFEVLHFQANGSQAMREVGVALGWGTLEDLASYNVLYTVVRRPE